LRLNITMVAPPGLSKSYAMRKFFHSTQGIVPFPFKYRGKITEAGFVGTVKQQEIIYGDAYYYAKGFLAFNEITNLFLASQTEHSGELLNQLMEALSEGHISKRLSTGEIDYDTSVTIWGGVQPRRFDFSQGLSRRFLFVARKWTEEDLEELKAVRGRRHTKLKGNRNNLLKDIEAVYEDFDVRMLHKSDSLHKYLMKVCDSHLQMTLIERALIGKEVFDSYSRERLVLELTNENRKLIDNIIEMQNMTAVGSDISLLLTHLDSNSYKTYNELFNTFRRYGYTLENFASLMERAVAISAVKVDYLVKSGRRMRAYRRLL